jgi:DNA-binding IclR family transcriptional regulator
VRQDSGVGVLDKSVLLLDCLAAGPAGLAELTARSGLPRATAHRLLSALCRHQLAGAGPDGRYHLGPRLAELAGRAPDDALLARAAAVLDRLQSETGESAQLYRRRDGSRVCVAAAEAPSGLRDTVPVGTVLPMTAGSAAQVLAAWDPLDQLDRLLAVAAYDRATLALVRRRGYAVSLAEREPGVGSLSAPVRDDAGKVAAAVSVSGPLERLGRNPGRRLARPVLAAAAELSGAQPRR